MIVFLGGGSDRFFLVVVVIVFLVVVVIVLLVVGWLILEWLTVWAWLFEFGFRLVARVVGCWVWEVDG